MKFENLSQGLYNSALLYSKPSKLRWTHSVKHMAVAMSIFSGKRYDYVCRQLFSQAI